MIFTLFTVIIFNESWLNVIDAINVTKATEWRLTWCGKLGDIYSSLCSRMELMHEDEIWNEINGMYVMCLRGMNERGERMTAVDKLNQMKEATIELVPDECNAQPRQRTMNWLNVNEIKKRRRRERNCKWMQMNAAWAKQWIDRRDEERMRWMQCQP